MEIHFGTVIALENPPNFPPAAGYFLQSMFSAMIEASSCRREMVQQSAHALNISFYAMIEARSCIGEIVQKCARALNILFYAMIEARSCIGEIVNNAPALIKFCFMQCQKHDPSFAKL